METDLAADLVELLDELSSAQSALFETLADKRRAILARDLPALAGVQDREHALVDRLQACQQRRTELLTRARAEGQPAETLRQLASSFPEEERRTALGRADEAAGRARLLQHQSLANWVLVQRSLIHLSQLLGIIATGGKQRPTYDKGAVRASSGALVDQAA